MSDMARWLADCGYETTWSEDSLRLIRERYARPLAHSIPGPYPIPAVPCANPKCTRVRKRKKSRRGNYEGLVGAHDLCASCYDRHRRAGFPASGVPDPMSDEERVARSREAGNGRPAPPAAQAKLQAGDFGYSPSRGTARPLEEAA